VSNNEELRRQIDEAIERLEKQTPPPTEDPQVAVDAQASDTAADTDATQA
jgi:hypothetical protein